MFRIIAQLVGVLAGSRASRRQPWYQAAVAAGPAGSTAPLAGSPGHAGGPAWPAPPGQQAAWPPTPGYQAQPGGQPPRGGPPGPSGGPRRRRIPRSVTWVAVLIVAGLVFRRAVAWAVITALSAVLHLVGINAHLPSIRFGWPWQSLGTGTTTTTQLGPWVLQKIQGISRPALGQANFSFYFTHKVSKSIGFWPCWYSATFYAAGHAAATVSLNPGPAWWARSTGHYQLRVLSAPATGHPGQVAVTMTLPRPQLPQSVHDVTIDNIPSRPIATDHSFTYPGLGCGVLLRPQFADSVLYAQAQQIAFYKSTHVPQVTGPLIASAERQATQTIQDNFIQPTVNAFGYTLRSFTLRWASGPPPATSPARPG